MLITILIRFQAKNDASQIMVLRDEHFKTEWRRTKFFFGYAIVLFVFMTSTVVVSFFFTDTDLPDENRERLYHFTIDVILLCDVAILVLLIVCGVRCACTTYHYYRYGFHRYKKRFSVIMINITLWAILVTLKDFFFFQYQNCLFKHLLESDDAHVQLDRCEHYDGSVFWTNLGFWLYGYPMKLPYFTFAMFDPACDILSNYNRYPEVCTRVSIFQYGDSAARLREKCYD